MAAPNENNKVRPLYLQQPCQNDLGGSAAVLLNVELSKAFITDYGNVFFFLSWRFADMYKGALTGVFYQLQMHIHVSSNRVKIQFCILCTEVTCELTYGRGDGQTSLNLNFQCIN